MVQNVHDKTYRFLLGDKKGKGGEKDVIIR